MYLFSNVFMCIRELHAGYLLHETLSRIYILVGKRKTFPDLDLD